MQQKVSNTTLLYALVVPIVLGACANEPYPGPDKQFGSMLEKAASGAGAGAITGSQLGAGTGPGAAVGAGIGAVAGGISGFMEDQADEKMLELSASMQEERGRAMAHEVLEDHFKRRLALHPTRDIFPADLFFVADSAELRSEAKPLIHELAALNKNRLPYSRLGVTVYVKSVDPESKFAKQLADKRSRLFSDEMISAGIEPRRIEARGVIVKEAVLIDPDDNPARYSQAVEITPIDR